MVPGLSCAVKRMVGEWLVLVTHRVGEEVGTG